MFGDFQDVYRDVTLMANSFNLRRGGLSMCPGDTCSEELQTRAAPNAHRLALLYREKQASKLQKRELLLSLHSSELWRSFALGSGGTICPSPVDKLISDDDLFLFLIHSSDLQEVFCLAMLIIV